MGRLSGTSTKRSTYRILAIILIFLITLITIWYCSRRYDKETEAIANPTSKIIWETDCFEKNFDSDFAAHRKTTNPNDLIFQIENILSADYKPKFSKSIFFHETSCSPDVLQLNARQACSVESAARMNPNWDVFLLFVSPSTYFSNSAMMFVEALTTYPNLHIRNVNLWSYIRQTPISPWIQNGQLFKSKYLISHTSDFLRYLSLYIWGGTYLDLDVVVQKNFDEIGSNFAGIEDEWLIGSGILNFNHSGVGHQVAEMCLRDFQENFDGNSWIQNGPAVITRVLKTFCNTSKPFEMTSEKCHGFNVLPKNMFTAIPWQSWRNLFDYAAANKTMDTISNSVAIHFWNKMSYQEVVNVSSNVAYDLIAKEFCPNVYKIAGNTF